MYFNLEGTLYLLIAIQTPSLKKLDTNTMQLLVSTHLQKVIQQKVHPQNSEEKGITIQKAIPFGGQ